MKTSFEDFKEEVYHRRDTKLIEQKKRNKRILTFSIPAVLIIGIIGLFPILPQRMEKSDNSMIAEDTNLFQEESAIQCTVSITKNENTVLLSNEDADLILNIIWGNNSLHDEFKEETKPQKPSDDKTLSPSSLLRITVTDNLGRNTHYQLEGSLLIRLNNGVETLLTEEEIVTIQNIANQLQ